MFFKRYLYHAVKDRRGCCHWIKTMITLHIDCLQQLQNFVQSSKQLCVNTEPMCSYSGCHQLSYIVQSHMFLSQCLCHYVPLQQFLWLMFDAAGNRNEMRVTLPQHSVQVSMNIKICTSLLQILTRQRQTYQLQESTKKPSLYNFTAM